MEQEERLADQIRKAYENMKFTFNDIMDQAVYEETKVIFILGKIMWFNNMVSDTLKGLAMDNEQTFEYSVELENEFGISDNTPDPMSSTSVNLNTFIEVIGVANINGKWFCKVDYSMLNKKQKDWLVKYIKEPSENGILIITCTDWFQYKEILRNRVLSISKYSHVIQLDYPSKPILKNIVKQSFEELNIDVAASAVDHFIMKMSRAYDKYEDQIKSVVEMHLDRCNEQSKVADNSDLSDNTLDKYTITLSDMKLYMKGIENFILDDFMYEIVKPMSSDKTNSKKVLKIMAALEDDIGAQNLVYRTLKIIDESIDFRVLINKGFIPIGINYFFNDVIQGLPDPDKYAKVKEWTFRRKADLASRTSLRDWEYMKIILTKAIENKRISDAMMEEKCKKAIYELCTRSVITSDRIDNIIGIKNSLNTIDIIDKVVYDEDTLHTLNS